MGLFTIDTDLQTPGHAIQRRDCIFSIPNSHIF